jgi:hypothetical protein
MRKINKICVCIAIVFIVVGCEDDSEFIETDCSISGHGVLGIQFTSEKAKREVTFSPEAKVITFKGTTYRDIKWSAGIDKVEEFVLNDANMLSIIFKDGNDFYFGKVSDGCKVKIKEHLGDLLRLN